MSQVKGKFIVNADIIDTSITSSTTKAPNSNSVLSGLAAKVATSAVGAANGVAPLDSNSKVPTANLPATVVGSLNYKGVLDASGGSYPGSPAQGDYYVVSVAGTISGVDYEIGDWAVYNGATWDKIDNSDKVSTVNGQTGTVVLDTDDISEGTNQYHTTARARAAAVVNSLGGSETDQAPSVSSVNTALGAKQNSFAWNKERLTLNGTDITNQYKDLAQVVKANSLDLVVSGVVQIEGVDYSLNLTGGAGGKTRVTFLGDLATGGNAALVNGDILDFKYAY